MGKLIVFAGLLATFLVVLIPNHLVNGECCGATRCNSQDLFAPRSCFCADGTAATPYCGYGPCNFFGCNCDGGCRVARNGPSLSKDELQKKEHERIASHSKSHVEQLDINEAYDLVKDVKDGSGYNGTLAQFTPIFQKADKDGNKKLTFEEINELKP